MTATDRIIIKVTETWSQPLLDQMVAFYSSLPRKTGWSGRWEVSSQYYSWKFALNPVRPAIGALAFDDGKLVGAVVVVFKLIEGRGKIWLAGEIGDLQIEAEYRGQGLFGTILRAAVADSLKAGAELIFCLPNSRATRSMIATGAFEVSTEASFATWLLPLQPSAMMVAKKLGWILRPLDRLSQAVFAPGRWDSKIHRSLVSPTADARVLEVKRGLRIAWSADQLSYRVLQYPVQNTYEGLSVAAFGRCNNIILRTATFQGASGLVVGRIACDADSEFTSALRAVAREGRDRNCAFVALWAPTSARFACPLLRHGFIPVQRKNFVIATEGRNRDIDLEYLRIDMLDSDKI